ncbi:MAG: MBL fold metallo-hydrolase [Clostridia bacterium]|nr:MBL fold metallo-hydrolase [Clostridia bacterium]
MARFCSLFSSSSGNSTFLSSGKTNILIDAGVSAKRLKEALLRRDIDPESIAGIFITHEHSDHISGVRVLAGSYKIPVYATEGTLSYMQENGTVNGKFPFEVIPYEGIEIGDMLIKPFTTPHDSRESCGYRIELPHSLTAAIATDIGKITDKIKENIIGCDLVMLESNHDIGMLQNGPYPYVLKRRILSDRGHLSNAACGDMAAELISKGTARLYLGHLSDENNFPELAFQTSLAAISEKTNAVCGRDYILEVCRKENYKDIVRF